MSQNCLNCASSELHNYCPNCGQKSTTHRYSIKHFIAHDLVHGVWHVDKGILFTVLTLFTRPGHGVREFIQGKRANYFSFVTLILLILSLTALLAPYVPVKMADLVPDSSKALMNDLNKFMTNYPKLVVIITIPVYALFSFLWFRKAKLNFSEHLVINSNRVIPELIISLVIAAISVFCTNKSILTFLYLVLPGVFSLSYSIWFYHQFFSAYNYSKKGLFFRSVLVPVSYFMLPFLIGIALGILQVIKAGTIHPG